MPVSSPLRNILKHRGAIANSLELCLSHSNPSSRWHEDTLTRLKQYSIGGKLLRGCLLCFSYQAFGGKNMDMAKAAATSLELIHSALLIHDDILDNDSVRRGRPAMHKQYESLAVKNPAKEKFGEGMAICAADAAIFLAMGNLGAVKVPGEQKDKLLRLFGEVLSAVCYGQMLDVEHGSTQKLPSKKAIYTIMEQKTANYSLSLPLAAGAVLANQPEDTINNLHGLGNAVGTIFQIRDDELGVFGDPAKTGKSVGSDIKEGKKTLLYYYLFKQCSLAQKRRLDKVFGNPKAGNADIEYVRKTMLELNIPDKINSEITSLSNQAFEYIDQLSASDKFKQDLRELVTFCAQREY